MPANFFLCILATFKEYKNSKNMSGTTDHINHSSLLLLSYTWLLFVLYSSLYIMSFFSPHIMHNVIQSMSIVRFSFYHKRIKFQHQLFIPSVRFDVSTNRLLFHPDKSGENENITIKLNTTVEFLYKIE